MKFIPKKSHCEISFFFLVFFFSTRVTSVNHIHVASVSLYTGKINQTYSHHSCIVKWTAILAKLKKKNSIQHCPMQNRKKMHGNYQKKKFSEKIGAVTWYTIFLFFCVFHCILFFVKYKKKYKNISQLYWLLIDTKTNIIFFAACVSISRRISAWLNFFPFDYALKKNDEKNGNRLPFLFCCSDTNYTFSAIWSGRSFSRLPFYDYPNYY